MPPAVASVASSVRRIVHRVRMGPIVAIVSPKREANVKPVLRLLVLLACLMPLPAFAGTFFAGAVRDRDGAAVLGARVVAYDMAAHVLGEGRVAGDGTFAFETDSDPAYVVVTCAYCVRSRALVKPNDATIVIVKRFAALRDRVPSTADLAALPYRSAGDLAALVPYTITTAGNIADRGLDRRRGAIVLDGIPLYRATDGAATSDYIAPYTIASLTARSPLAAPAYGTYAQGGIVDVTTLGAPLARIDGGNAADFIARAQTQSIRALVATASDASDTRRNATIEANLPLAGGTLQARVLSLADLASSLSGATLGYTTASRRAIFATTIAARTGGGESFVGGSATVSTRGATPLSFGLRASRASGVLPDGSTGVQSTQALVLNASANGPTSSLQATLAYERDGDALRFGSLQANGLTASVSDDVQLGEHFRLHGGVLRDLRVPTLLEAESAALPDRSVLLESSVTYTDLARLRVAAVAYDERIASVAKGHLSGVGIDGVWQIAPAFALHAWTLETMSRATVASQSPYGYPLDTHRRVVWLTAGETLRVDAIVRSGPLEGDIRFPFGAYAAIVGSSIRAGVRVTTLGVSTR